MNQRVAEGVVSAEDVISGGIALEVTVKILQICTDILNTRFIYIAHHDLFHGSLGRALSTMLITR